LPPNIGEYKLKKVIIIFLSFFLLRILSAQASDIKVALNERTVLDNGFYFLTVFHDKPKEKLILPNNFLS
jgi:hypothetical protein